MNPPDFEQAKHYALERLARELPPSLFYHSVIHTRDEVVPAVEQLAAVEGITGEALLLLQTAAYFHDIGFIECYTGHEAAGVRIAAAALPRFGYAPAHLAVIGEIILTTRLPQSPRTRLEEIMADADLDLLGREAFWTRNYDLRAELAALGRQTTDDAWLRGQLKFIQSHRYFTAAARALRDAGKQKNAQALRTRLANGAG